MVVVGLLTTLAKKLLAEQAKKFGKAVYDRTLKPVLGAKEKGEGVRVKFGEKAQ